MNEEQVKIAHALAARPEWRWRERMRGFGEDGHFVVLCEEEKRDGVPDLLDAATCGVLFKWLFELVDHAFVSVSVHGVRGGRAQVQFLKFSGFDDGSGTHERQLASTIGEALAMSILHVLQNSNERMEMKSCLD